MTFRLSFRAFMVNIRYNENRKLNGIIYVQTIAHPRFSGQAARNLRMFKNLCGTESYKNVVVLTTSWDLVSKELGQKREAQLKSQTLLMEAHALCSTIGRSNKPTKF